MPFVIHRDNLSSVTHTWKLNVLHRIKSLVFFSLYQETTFADDRAFLLEKAVDYATRYVRSSILHGDDGNVDQLVAPLSQVPGLMPRLLRMAIPLARLRNLRTKSAVSAVPYAGSGPHLFSRLAELSRQVRLLNDEMIRKHGTNRPYCERAFRITGGQIV